MIANVRSGQLSNRLVSTAYALASAIEYRRNIWLTEFDDLKDNYECKVTWPQKVKIKYSRFWALERWLAEKIKARFKAYIPARWRNLKSHLQIKEGEYVL